MRIKIVLAIGAVALGCMMILAQMRSDAVTERQSPAISESNRSDVQAPPASPQWRLEHTRSVVPLRLRMASRSDRIDASKLERVEREDGAVALILPNGTTLWGAENMEPGPERKDVLPALDLLNRYPEIGFGYQREIDDDAIAKCRSERDLRQGPATSYYTWNMIIHASLKDGKLKVDSVTSDTYPSDFDRAFFDCIVDVLSKPEWDSVDGVTEIGFEHPWCQKPALTEQQEDM